MPQPSKRYSCYLLEEKLNLHHSDFFFPKLLVQVDVGDFLRFKSCVLYTQLENPSQPLINIEVEAHVTRPELRTSEVSS